MLHRAFALALALGAIGCATTLQPAPAPQSPAAVEEKQVADQASAAGGQAQVAEVSPAVSTEQIEQGSAPGKPAQISPAGNPTDEAIAEQSSDSDDDQAGDDVEDDGGPESELEAASLAAPPAGKPGVRYTNDIDDHELERLWKEEPKSLGSLSVGFADAGRLVNGQPFPQGERWTIVDPNGSWGTSETIGYVIKAIDAVNEKFEGTPAIRVNHLSAREGGWMSPHRSHQSGRDIDLAFYYRTGGPDRGAKAVKDNFDLARNWALVRALVSQTDVQMILIDKSIIKRLYDYALSIGEDHAWLDSVFYAGRSSILMHAKRHKDHFHVRFFNPRAQELGRRVLPLMPKGRIEQNVVAHRVKNGECLGSIARRYHASVAQIRKANRIKDNMIRVGRTLVIPMHGACTSCPVPPEVIVPPRRVPPTDPSIVAGVGGASAAGT